VKNRQVFGPDPAFSRRRRIAASGRVGEAEKGVNGAAD